jgi:hypothetical protein
MQTSQPGRSENVLIVQGDITQMPFPYGGLT